MGRENVILLVASVARTAAKDEADWPARIEAAMKAAKDDGSFFTMDEDEQFRGAIGGLLMLANELGDEDMTDRLTAEVDGIKVLNAMFSGIPVNLDAVKVPDNPLGLIQIWKKQSEGAKP